MDKYENYQQHSTWTMHTLSMASTVFATCLFTIPAVPSHWSNLPERATSQALHAWNKQPDYY